MMIAQPAWITDEAVAKAIADAAAKKSLEAIRRVRTVLFREGPSVQILHIGSYADETPVLERLHIEYMPANHLTFNGKHHEIYLNAPGRTAPEKLKTILRQPVKPLV